MNSKAYNKKQWALFLTGLIAVIVGISVLGFFGIRKVYREYQKQKLMRDNPVVEIDDLHIKAPILEGTDNGILRKAAGHFSGTGDFGKDNYCIAAHSSTLYKEYFNNLRQHRIYRFFKNEIKLYQIPTYRMKREEVKTVIFRYIFGYYNTLRINSFNEGSKRL